MAMHWHNNIHEDKSWLIKNLSTFSQQYLEGSFNIVWIFWTFDNPSLVCSCKVFFSFWKPFGIQGFSLFLRHTSTIYFYIYVFQSSSRSTFLNECIATSDCTLIYGQFMSLLFIWWSYVRNKWSLLSHMLRPLLTWFIIFTHPVSQCSDLLLGVVHSSTMLFGGEGGFLLHVAFLWSFWAAFDVQIKFDWFYTFNTSSMLSLNLSTFDPSVHSNNNISPLFCTCSCRDVSLGNGWLCDEPVYSSLPTLSDWRAGAAGGTWLWVCLIKDAHSWLELCGLTTVEDTFAPMPFVSGLVFLHLSGSRLWGQQLQVLMSLQPVRWRTWSQWSQ